MTLHRADIYHCQKCGGICSREHSDPAPVCCEERTVRALANVVYEDDCDDVGSVDDVIEQSHRTKPPPSCR